MLAKLICFFFGHDIFMPADEKMAALVGGMCKRCLMLTRYPELSPSTGTIIEFKKMEKLSKKVTK